MSSPDITFIPELDRMTRPHGSSGRDWLSSLQLNSCSIGLSRLNRMGEGDGAQVRRQRGDSSAMLEQLKIEFLKNTQVLELSNEEALQECLQAEVTPFWPAAASRTTAHIAHEARR